jgi:hypothetical protein
MFNNRCGIQEKLRIEIYDRNSGEMIDYRETYNPSSLIHRLKKLFGFTGHFAGDIVLDAGLADVADMIAERYQYVAIGTDDTPPEHDDTGLISEILREEATVTQVTTFYTNDTSRYTVMFTPTYDTTFCEASICKNASSGGDDIVFARETFVPFDATTSNSFVIIWDVVVMR